LTAEAHDASGAVIPGAVATWSISNTAVATFNDFGQLRAVATGTVRISATVRGVTGTQTLTITPAMRVVISLGPKEVVFRWATDRCYDLDVPDQQPRAVRAEDGSIVLFAGNAPRYYVSRGADFGSLKRDCRGPVLESAYRPDPESYENGEWPWVFYREGNRWHALVSNEFHDAVAGTCKPGDPEPANPCWYNSVTYAVSTDGARTFTKPDAPAHVVAPPPHAWAPPLPGDVPSSFYFPQGRFYEGYGPPNGIVRRNDGYFYGSLYAVPSKSDPGNNGACIIRTDRLGDPASWRAWDGSGFNLPLTSPYVTGHPGPMCTLSRSGWGGAYDPYLDGYLSVGMGAQMVEGKRICGVFFSLSADLFHWGPAQLLVETTGADCAAGPETPGVLEPVDVNYVSLIDHADPTVNFENPGRTPYLYYVRFNRSVNDPLYWLDRDLVRVPLTFTRVD